MSLRSAAWVAVIAFGAAACGQGERAAPPVARSLSIADVGLHTPESVLPDPTDDVYLVSNVNGAPLDTDDNGFISRIGPDGSVLTLQWIDGASPDVTLNAPKGLGIRGDTLFVADIDVVRLFDRTTGAPLGAWAVPGATFLNDIAIGPDGQVYVTDTGLKAGADGFEPSHTEAIYRFEPDGTPVAVARGDSLGAPNGITFDGARLITVTFGSGQVLEVDAATGKTTALPTPPAGSLDGVVALGNGVLLVSSWEGQAVYELGSDGQYTVVADSVESPADIGFDATRRVLLIPLFNRDRVEVRPVP